MNHDNFDQRIRFLELLTIVQGKTLLLYRGLLHEALHKFDSTYEPDSLLEWFQAEIDRQVQEWIRSEADADPNEASRLHAMYEELKKSNGGKL